MAFLPTQKDFLGDKPELGRDSQKAPTGWTQLVQVDTLK